MVVFVLEGKSQLGIYLRLSNSVVLFTMSTGVNSHATRFGTDITSKRSDLGMLAEYSVPKGNDHSLPIYQIQLIYVNGLQPAWIYLFNVTALYIIKEQGCRGTRGAKELICSLWCSTFGHTVGKFVMFVAQQDTFRCSQEALYPAPLGIQITAALDSR